MKPSWIRNLAVPFALACAAMQVVPGSAFLASALTLGFAASHHRHSVSLVAGEGHLHLVLSHEERADRHPEVAHHHGDPAVSASEGNHVFHLTDVEASNTTPRRTALAPAPIAIITVAWLPAPSRRSVGPRPEPRARSSDFLRTIVLRI